MKYKIDGQTLTDIGDAIRAKTGGSASMTPLEMPDEIASIISSGPEIKEVTFFDYDGTVLYSYTTEEFLALTAMPAIVSNTEMTSQGWNWTFAGAKTWVQKYGMLSIGQTRVPADNSTRIIINAEAGKTFKFTMSGTYSGTVDWGDESTPETLAQNNTHVYMSDEWYTVRIHTITGNHYMLTFSDGGYMVDEVNLGIHAVDEILTNYGDSLCNVRVFSFSNGITKINGNFLRRDVHLKSLIHPTSITTIGYFDQVYYSLKAISYPEGFVASTIITFPKAELITVASSSPGYAQNMHACKYFVIADDLTAFSGNQHYRYLYNLEKLYIPKNVTSIANNYFQDMWKIKKIVIPEHVTELVGNDFMTVYCLEELTLPEGLLTIGVNCFTDARSLSKITIPSTVTSIGSNCFSQLHSTREIHLLPTTPPTLGSTNSFNNTNIECVIYVPQGSLSAYQSATNWSTYASKMQEEPT